MYISDGQDLHAHASRKQYNIPHHKCIHDQIVKKNPPKLINLVSEDSTSHTRLLSSAPIRITADYN